MQIVKVLIIRRREKYMRRNKLLLGLKTGILALALATAIPFGANAASVKSPDGPYLDESKMTEEEKEGYELTKKYEKTLPKINPNSNIPKKYFSTRKRVTNRNASDAKYDSRKKGVISPIKDQNMTGTCWCFSLMEACQASYLSKNGTGDTSADFSEYQLSYFIYNQRDDKLGLSGDTVYTPMDNPGSEMYYTLGATDLGWVFASTKTIGLIPEEDAKFTDLIEGLHDSGEAVLPEDYCYNKNTYTVSGVKILDPKLQRDAVKSLIVEYGAGQISYFHNSECFDYSTYAFYTSEELSDGFGGGHAVNVVGWDDNYSKDNFAYAPPGDGAWLIKNSWGDVWGNDGYFWMSYYEPTMGSVMFYDVENAKDYDNIYQYDGTLSQTVLSGYEMSANVFTAQNDELLDAVSFFTVADNTKCEISIYKNPDAGKPDSGDCLKQLKPVTIDHMGYTKLKLDESIKLKKGDKFSIVVKQTSEDNKPADIYCDRYFNEYFIIDDSVSHAGESYAIKAGARKWEDISADKQSNLRIKAFTRINESVTGSNISFEKDSYTVSIDKIIDTKVLLDETDATGKAKIEYSVENPDIAFIDSAGKIHGRMVGDTTITATYNGKSASAEVHVTLGSTAIKINKDENYATKSNPYKIDLAIPFNLKYTVEPSSYRDYIQVTAESLDPNDSVNIDDIFGIGEQYIFLREGKYKITIAIEDHDEISGGSQDFYVEVKAPEVVCGDDYTKIAADPYKDNSLIFYRYNNPDYSRYKIQIDSDIEEFYDCLMVVGLDSNDITNQRIYDVVFNDLDDEVDEIDVYDVVSGKDPYHTVIVDKPYIAFVFSSDENISGRFAVTNIEGYNPLEQISINSKDLVINTDLETSKNVNVKLLPEDGSLDELCVSVEDGRIAEAYYEDGHIVINPLKVGLATITVGSFEAVEKSEGTELEYSPDEDGNLTSDVIRINLTVPTSKEVPSSLGFIDGEGNEISELTIAINETQELILNDPDWNNYVIKYESDDNTIAYVDSEGNITGVSTGKAQVEVAVEVPVEDEDGNTTIGYYTQQLQINVIEPDEHDMSNLQSMHGYIRGTDEIYTYTSSDANTECMNLYFDRRTDFEEGDYITIQDGNGYYYGYNYDTGIPITKLVKTETKLTDEFRLSNGYMMSMIPLTIYSNTVKIHFVSKEGIEEYYDEYSGEYYTYSEGANLSTKYGFRVKRLEEGLATKTIEVKDMSLDFSTYRTFEKRLEITKTPENAIDKLYYSSDDGSVASVSDEGVVLGHGDGSATISVYTLNPNENIVGECTVNVSEKKITGAKFYNFGYWGKEDQLENPATVEVPVNDFVDIIYNKVPWNASQDIIIGDYDSDAFDVDKMLDYYGDNIIEIYGRTEGEYKLEIYIPSDDGQVLVQTLNIVVKPESRPEIPEEYMTFSAEAFLQDGNDGIEPTEITEDEIRHVNYDDDESIYWTYKRDGAEYVDITFAKNSSLQLWADWIYIYDLDGNLIGRYTGDKNNDDEETRFAGMTIRVPGEGFIIGFVSDDWDTDDGFRILEIKPHFGKKPAEPTPTPAPSEKPKGDDKKATPSPSPSSTPTAVPEDNTPKVGDIVKDDSGKASYKILSADTVAYAGLTSKKAKSATIPATAKISGKKYKVTEIAANAFKNNKKLKKVTVGTNIIKINNNAFYGCKKLKTINIKSKKLKTVGKNAVKGIYKKAVIKAPKAKVKAYKKLFTKKTGFKKPMKIKK